MQHITILGMGWLGLPLAANLKQAGYTVNGSVTSPEKKEALIAKGYDVQLVLAAENGMAGETKKLLKHTDIVIILIPPGLRRNSGHNHALKMAHVLEAIEKAGISKAILVSSTGVYADNQGNVTERDMPKPDTNRGQQLLEVEQMFVRSTVTHATVVRFGGLFGGSRNPVKYLAGREDLSNGQAPVNLIHRNDCIAIIKAIIAQDNFDHIFNAVIPLHPTKQEHYTQQAVALGLKPPKFKDPDENTTYKQVDSSNLTEILDYTFKHTL